MYHASFQSDRRLHTVQEHKGLIADLQASSDQGMIITACKDTSAKVRWSCDHWSGSHDFWSGIFTFPCVTSDVVQPCDL